MNPYLLGFRCSLCGVTYAPSEVTYTCPRDSGNLDALYDYERMRAELDPRWMVYSTDRSIWRYAPLLPVVLPEAHLLMPTPLSRLGWSPLYRALGLERALNLRMLWLKDDSRLPSASFKDRASAMVIARALEAGYHTLCVASTGNAASALAALCAGLPLRVVIFVPEGTPEAKLAAMLIHGAQVFIVRGSYNDAVSMATEACARFGWYNRSTGINPYTREGKKTAAYEIAEQLAQAAPTPSGFRAPDVVIVPVGDGNIISGLHKGFRDLHALGWIDRMPRFIGVTAALAPSLYRAWQRGDDHFETIPSQTLASGISVDRPCDGVMALRAVRETGGALVEATDEAMLEAMRWLAAAAGVFVEPACAAALVGLTEALDCGLVSSEEEIVLQLTGSGLKDVRSALRAAGQPRTITSLDEIAAHAG
ncbi:MAG: threonine synthase [Anaerolineae bacterium]|nr:threonine synthase [Anaerolineae bacterium]